MLREVGYIYIYVYICYILIYFLIIFQDVVMDRKYMVRVCVIYIYIYILYYRRLGGVRPTGKSFRFVSFVRACVCARGLVVEWNFGSIYGLCPLPFPFCRERFSLFPCGVRVSPSETKWDQARPSETM